MLFQSADDRDFGEPAALHLWFFHWRPEPVSNRRRRRGNVSDTSVAPTIFCLDSSKLEESAVGVFADNGTEDVLEYGDDIETGDGDAKRGVLIHFGGYTVNVPVSDHPAS